jgi:hypothetical protein
MNQPDTQGTPMNPDTSSRLSDLVNDEDFDKLELELRNTNIFSILGIERKEIRHSNFLAWLLDPNGTHGLGPLFLKRFLRDIFLLDNPESANNVELDEARTRNMEIRREWEYIDILLVSENLVICIENKVSSSDAPMQLKRYRETVRKYFPDQQATFVYLTPEGRNPNDEDEHNSYINYSYEKISSHLGRIFDLHRNSMAPSTAIYLNDYLNILRTNLLRESELNTTIKRIYRNHKEALSMIAKKTQANPIAHEIYKSHKETFDFISANKPDLSSLACTYVKEKAKKEKWIPGSCSNRFFRFLTKDLDRIIPKNANGWKLKEQFLFEFNFWEHNGTLDGYFATGISPRGTPEAKAIIRDAIDRVDDPARKTNIKATKWILQIRLKIKPTKTADHQKAETQAQDNIDQAWDRVCEIVAKTEAQLKQEEAKLLLLMYQEEG